MKLFLSSIWIVAIVGWVQLLGLVSARSADTNKAVLVSALRTPPAVPAEPVLKTPIDFFRELLALNSIERNKVLADRTP